MDQYKFRWRFSLSLWLPLFAVLFSAAIVWIPAARVYTRWKAAIGNGDNLTLTAGQFQMVVPRQGMLRRAVEMNAMQEQDTIALLNAPGQLLGAVASQLVVQHANGSPKSLGPFLWRVVSIPLFAIPAWFFAGRGVDGLLLRRRMSRVDLVLSVTLVLLSVTLSLGLHFSSTASERAGDELLTSYIFGFAWWSLLFALPLSGWVRQKLRRRNTVSVIQDV